MRRGATSPGRSGPDGTATGPSVLRPALWRFALSSLLTATLLFAVTFWVADGIARRHALEDARRAGAGVATRIAAPLVDAQVRAGVPGAAAQLTTVMDNRMRDGSVGHVKLWSADGTVVWSDQPEIVGRRFDLSADVERLFGTTRTVAEISELSRAENVAERGEGPLLEVYVGTFDADGQPLVVEVYLDTEPIKQTAQGIVTSFVPVIAGALVLLLLVVLPLAVSLSRRVESGQRDRARLMRHAVVASDLERRRIAQDLHDGVVQELAGVGYTLPTVTRELAPGGDLVRARTTLEQLTALVQSNVLALRTFMTDIYPPDLTGPGLRDAINQLARTEAMAAGFEVDVDIPPDLELPVEPARLAHRIVREAIRNVVKHADARRVRVELLEHQDLVVVRVVDDGRGWAAGTVPRSGEGHLGLRLLADTVRDVGGKFEVTSQGPGSGVRVVASLPRVLRGT